MTPVGGVGEARSLVMPRAIPMGYGEQRYDAFVSDVVALDATGRRTPAEREEGPRWRLPAGTTRVDYRVDLRRLEREVRAASDQSRVRDGYLAVLGYSVFAFVDGFETRPTTLRVEGPDGWPVFSTLAPAAPVAMGSVSARADDYYALADGQIVMGPRAMVRRLTDRPRRSTWPPIPRARSTSIASAASPSRPSSASPTTSAPCPSRTTRCTRSC